MKAFSSNKADRPSLLFVVPYFFPQNSGGAPRLFDMLLSNISRFKAIAFASNAGKNVDDMHAFDQDILRRRNYHVMRGRLGDVAVPAGSSILAKILHTMWWLLEQWLAIRRVLTTTQPKTVVCGNTFHCGWLLNRLHEKYIKVNVVHGEELTMNLSDGPLSTWLKREQIRALESADLNIAVSRYSAQKILECSNTNAQRIAVLPNAVDIEHFKPCHDRVAVRSGMGWEGHTVMLTVARLIKRKGIDQVLRALAAANDLPDNWIYVIAGQGPCEKSLKALTRELGLSHRVHFPGHVDEEQLPDLFGAADIFVQTNRCVDGDTEGFGIVFLEASACGTPVIGGIAGGTGDAIEHEVSGLRVDGDDVNAIGWAISRLCNDPDLRRKMADRGLARVRKEFSAQHHAKRFEALIAQVGERSQPKRRIRRYRWYLNSGDDAVSAAK
jgi:phosphatidyl-myo-inositol dimannoside synthase